MTAIDPPFADPARETVQGSPFVSVKSDVESLRRHLGGEIPFPYVDFQEQDTVTQALQRWELLRRIFGSPMPVPLDASPDPSTR